MISFMWIGKVFVSHTGIRAYKVYCAPFLIILFLFFVSIRYGRGELAIVRLQIRSYIYLYITYNIYLMDFGRDWQYETGYIAKITSTI